MQGASSKNAWVLRSAQDDKADSDVKTKRETVNLPPPALADKRPLPIS